MRSVVNIIVSACLLGTSAAQELQVPKTIPAGTETSVSTSGSGRATFYLVGPGISSKNDVTLGQEITLKAKDVQKAGKYEAVLCTGTCRSSAFFVTSAAPASLTFLVHPSRVPVSLNDAVSGVALPFDQFHNLVLAPTKVDFQLVTGK